jgi:hypothetical protein
MGSPETLELLSKPPDVRSDGDQAAATSSFLFAARAEMLARILWPFLAAGICLMAAGNNNFRAGFAAPVAAACRSSA